MSPKNNAEEFARDHPRLARTIERIVLFPYRVRTRKKERERITVLEQTIASLRSEHKRAQERGYVDRELVLNVALYSLLFDRDFASLKEFFLSANSDWDRRFLGRQMAVMLYEGTQELPFLIGKDFRAMLTRLEVSDALMGDINRIRGRLADFKRKHAGRLKEVRNSMAAHRDRDVVLQLKLLDGLDRFEVYRTSVEFYEIIRDLTPALTKMMTEMGTLRLLLKQIAAARPQ